MEFHILARVLLYTAVVMGCGYTCWQIGIKEGASMAIDKLAEAGFIKFDDNGNIQSSSYKE